MSQTLSHDVFSSHFFECREIALFAVAFETLDTITAFRVFPAELGKIPRMYFIWIENSGAHGINVSENYIPETLHVPCFLHVIIMLDDFM